MLCEDAINKESACHDPWLPVSYTEHVNRVSPLSETDDQLSEALLREEDRMRITLFFVVPLISECAVKIQDRSWGTSTHAYKATGPTLARPTSWVLHYYPAKMLFIPKQHCKQRITFSAM
jgi:hypothetical protein